MTNFERSLAAARQALQQAEFAASRQAGASMTLEQIISRAVGHEGCGVSMSSANSLL